MFSKSTYYFLFALVLVTISFSFLAAQTRDEKDELMWSRIRKSNTVPTENTTVIPVSVSTEIRKVQTQNGVAVVYPNIPVHPSSVSTQSELSIITHPTNPNIVLGGSNAAEITSIDWISQGWYISTNGGTTWRGSDTLPPHLPQFTLYTSDPAVAIDLQGNMYFNTLLYGGSAGDVVTTKSTDMGTTWSSFAAVPNTTTGEDKNHFVCDVNPSSNYVGYLYTAYTEFDLTPRKINFSRSTNGGATFSAPLAMSEPAGYGLDQGVNMAIGPNGEVYVAYTSYTTGLTQSNISLKKSTDGGATFGSQINIVSAQADPRGTLNKGGNSVRANGFPSLSVDRSNGSRRGWVYAVWGSKVSGNPDVVFARSVDGGNTWSVPKKVSQENTNLDQWHGWTACDPSTGALYVMYYDSRNYPANDSAQVYLSRSLDGGDTFEDVLISDHAFLPKSIVGLAGGYMGDYNGVTANGGIVYCFWNDNRTGHHQAYVGKAIFGPTIEHEELGNTEDLNGPYVVEASISSSGVPLNPSSVKLFWTSGTVFSDSLQMTHTTGDMFEGNIPGNGQSADYRYYIQASDSIGGTSKLPAGAPTDYFMFSAATDTIPPVIAHDALGNQYLEEWPQEIEAEVMDNIGIDSVWCVWEVNSASGAFVLQASEYGMYVGEFYTDTVTLNVGDDFHYILYAKDAGSGGLIARYPATGSFTFEFIADTVAPTVEHSALRDQPKMRWPSTVKAIVEDVLGIENVNVEWYKNDISNATSFELTNTNDNRYEGTFNSDTNSVAIGDSIFYRVKATDASNSGNVTYVPAEGYYKFYIIATKGFALVIDDDNLGMKRSHSKRIISKLDTDTISAQGSAQLFVNTLTEVGFIVDTMKVPNVDTTNWDNYDILVWSHGRSSSPADQVMWRNAMISRVLRGMSVIVEGGDIGWQYMSSTPDVSFATNVLHCNDFVTEGSTLANPMLKDGSHPLATTPNSLPATFTLEPGSFVGVYDRDGNQPMPDAALVYKWSGTDTLASIVAWDDTPNPIRGRVVYISFNINNVVKEESTHVKHLIENAADWLVGSEPLPTGSLSGTVTLNNAPNNAGAMVRIKGPARDETIETPASGEYMFQNLYPGTHKVYVWKQAYYPALDYKVVTVGSDPVLNINFSLTPTAPVSGKVTLQGAPNNSGATVQIVGPGINYEIITPESGNYQFSGLNGGTHKIYAWKTGFYPYKDSLTVYVSTDTLTNNNFLFAPIVPGILFGNVTLTDTNNHSGVTVSVVNQNLSTVTTINGSYIIQNTMPGALNIRFSKEGYRRKDTVATMPNGGFITMNVTLDATSGIVLIIDDDNLNGEERIKEPNGASHDTINTGGSAQLFASTLSELGYTVEVRTVPQVDTSGWDGYDFVIWSHGRSSSPADSVKWRRAMSNLVQNGGKLIIEGGDIGWQYMSSTPDVDFATYAMRCNDFITETSTLANPLKNAFDHPLVSTPNQLPDIFTLDAIAGVYDRDGNLPGEGAIPVYVWQGNLNTSSLVAWEASSNPLDARVVYMSFNINNVVKEESLTVKALIENSAKWLNTGGTVGIETKPVRIPTEFALEQNYPNPFNPTTNIRFALPVESFVTISVYNVVGQKVATVLNGTLGAGYRTVEWNSSATLSSGVYFYRIDAVPTNGAKSFTKINKMVLMK
ncbi:MAG: T9SS type A sorting domain-containing protein [Ignavibacteria bacterium]|nr:T9SS type A sorting domain-containing protein [Ignavibacteria bacterium]